jgi:hypothetical protein
MTWAHPRQVIDVTVRFAFAQASRQPRTDADAVEGGAD